MVATPSATSRCTNSAMAGSVADRATGRRPTGPDRPDGGRPTKPAGRWPNRPDGWANRPDSDEPPDGGAGRMARWPPPSTPHWSGRAITAIAGRPSTVRAPTSRCGHQRPSQVFVCLFDDAGHETRLALPDLTLGVWHGYVPGVQPGSATASGPTDPGPLRRTPLQRGQAAPRSVRARHRRRADRRARSSRPAAMAPGTPETRHRTSRGVWWSAPTTSTGRVTGARRRSGGAPSSTRRTSRASPGASQGSPRAPRDVRGHRAPGDDRLPQGPGSHRHRAAARPPLRVRAALPDLGLVNYWGYNSVGFFAPHAATAPPGRGRAGYRVQGDGQGPARRRDRGHPRRGLQPHRRGRPPGRRCASGA